MKERSLLALFAVPLLWALASMMGAGSSLQTSPESTQAESGKGKADSPSDKAKAVFQRSRPLKTACDVLWDYSALPEKPEQPIPSKQVIISIKDAKEQAASVTVQEARNEERKCDIDAVKSAYKDKLQAAFVFIQDPNTSGLALETDRSLDAIRLALSKEGYIPYKNNTFPWKTPHGADADGKQKDSEEDAGMDWPGVWLFRQIEKNDLKLLFLIGDSPTAGISKRQFQNAISQHFELTGSHQLDIVGPIFSGSIDSLGFALKHTCLPEPNCRPWKVNATSGTVEVPDREARLKALVGDSADVKFKQIAKKQALNDLLELLDGPTGILIESDTVFGQEMGKGREIFRYSRDLLNLRTAYESDKDLMARIFPKSVRPDQLALHFGLNKEVRATIPIYAPENLAVSQQITLRHLASNLHRRNFANLVIVASDNIDSLFLARFFQEENPNLRIAVLDSDALLDREAGSVSLRGILTISQQHTGSVALSPIEFPDGQALGIYRACLRQLFGQNRLNEFDEKNALNRVVSVVGFDGEWPVKVLPPEPGGSMQAVSTLRDSRRFRWGRPIFAFLLLLLWLTLAPSVVHRRPTIAGLKLIPFCRPAAQGSPELEAPRLRWIRICFWTGLTTSVIPIIFGVAALIALPRTAEYSALVARYFYFGNGVSPLLPFTALLLAIHACAWSRVRSCYLQSYAFHPEPHPLPMASTHDGKEVEILLKTVRCHAETFFDRRQVGMLLVAAVAATYFYDIVIKDVEIEIGHGWSKYIWTSLFVLVGVLVVNTAARLLLLWTSLKRLLCRLEYHPLRIGFTTLPDRVSWTSIWSLSGTRPTMVSLQMSSDYLCTIDEESKTPKANLDLRKKIDSFMQKVHDSTFHTDHSAHATMQEIQAGLNSVTSAWIWELSTNGSWSVQRIEGWQHSSDDASPQKDKSRPLLPFRVKRDQDGSYVTEQPAEEKQSKINKLKTQFIALQYAAFIRYAFMQLRNLLGFLATSMTLFFIALNVYPFQPIGTLTNFASFLFCIASIVVVTVFLQMDRDPLLSRLANTTAGKLDSGFGWRLLQFGLLPTVTFLATHFPPIGQSLVKLLQIIPGLAKL